MTASTVTSIERFVLLKSTVAEQSARTRDSAEKSTRSSDSGSIVDLSKGCMIENDHYDKRISLDAGYESRMADQNGIALAVRDTDHTMQRIGHGIHQMQDALETMVKLYPPYPPGSEERVAVLKMVNTFRKEIEQLTFPRPAGDNVDTRQPPTPTIGPEAGMPTTRTNGDADQIQIVPMAADDPGKTANLIPGLAEDASDVEIRASILQLRKAGALIQRQRKELKAVTETLFSEKDAIADPQAAEFKSLFIGKHLGHHPDSDLTTTPSILRGYLN